MELPNNESSTTSINANELNLNDLPIELLIYMSKFCNQPSIGKLCCLNKRFNSIIIKMNRYIVSSGRYRTLTNQFKSMTKDSKRLVIQDLEILFMN